MENQNMLFLIAGSTGAGKTTVIRRAIEIFGKENLDTFPTCTTRTPRDGEVNGRDYIFFDKDSFRQAIRSHEVVEAKKVYNNFYGTHLPAILDKMQDTKVLIKDFDVQGYQNVMRRIAYSLNQRNELPLPMVSVLIDAPDTTLLTRISGRNDNTNITERQQYLSYERECKERNIYSYRIDNSSSDPSICLDELCKIINKEYQRNFGEPLSDLSDGCDSTAKSEFSQAKI